MEKKQPSIAGEPEMLSDGIPAFLGVMTLGLMVAIVVGGLWVVAMVAAHLLQGG